MARFQLKNQMGLPLRRVRITGSGFTLEPPEQVAESETGQWIANESGTVIYDVASRDGEQNPAQDSAYTPNKPFTLSWDFTAPGQVRARARNVARGVHVQVTQGPTGTLITVMPRCATFVPLPRRLPAALVPAITALLVLALATIAFGANLVGRSPATKTPLVQGPTVTVTATATPTSTPPTTGPVVNPPPVLHGKLALSPSALALGNFCGDSFGGATLTLANSGNGSLTWRPPSGGGIALAPAGGQLGAGASVTVQAQGTKANTSVAITWLDGGRGAPQTRSVALSCVAKVVNFSITPSSAFWDCNTQGLFASPATLTLSNVGSNVPVGWQISARENASLDPGVPWATFSQTQGTIAAGGTGAVTVSPLEGDGGAATLCFDTPKGPPTTAYHADVTLTSGGSGTFTFTYVVNGYAS